jgi:putative transposase
MVDLYWSWVWDPNISGNPPTISDHIPMVMTEMTCVFGPSNKASRFGWWLRFSGLQSGKRIQIPLVSTPYFASQAGLAKTVLVSKTPQGRWRFQFSEELPDPVLIGTAGKVGLDVGLNCLAATSDGRLYGRNFKPRFDRAYAKVRDLRANRQRQSLKENSPRLAKLERRLSGQAKTAMGTVANKLVKSFPGHTFVVEDLDLRGCKGQKRFAYRALHTNLSHKTVVQVVNPAYTSQQCPSCGYVSPENRSSIKFACKACGRKSHADVVGAINLLGRSEDKQIGCKTYPSAVKDILRARYRDRRKANSDSAVGCRPSPLRAGTSEPVPSGRRLTVRVPNGSCIASKSIS